MSKIINQIKKRNETLVEFKLEKIETAIKHAFFDVTHEDKSELAKHIAELVLKELELEMLTQKDYTPNVEHVQDVVERSIAKAGFFEVAKGYIIYRYEHRKIRQEVVAQKIEKHELLITKRSGAGEPYREEKLRKYLEHHAIALQSVDLDLILKQVRIEIFSGMTTTEIHKALIMVVRSLVERDYDYSLLASRLLRSQIYQEVLSQNNEKIDWRNLEKINQEAFVKYITGGVVSGLFDARMLEFDLLKISKMMDISRDFYYDYHGMQTLGDRYLMCDGETRRKKETPQMMYLRVAMGTALLEKPENKEKVVSEFYFILSELYFTSGGRTIKMAGATCAQMSNCFLSLSGDSLSQIFKIYADNAQFLKWGGGIATSWSNVRGTGALVKKIRETSQGIVPWLRIANDVIISINRSGKRRGNECVYLETWHYDILDFLELRKNTGDERRRTHDLNTANWIPDLFMKRLEANADWTLMSPDEAVGLHETFGKDFEKKYVEYENMCDAGQIKLWKRMPAQDLWKKMISMLYETGHPWITFKDVCNIRSPQDHVGRVHCSNLCTEITLNTSKEEIAVCNLGSVNIAKFITDEKKFDEILVQRVLRAGMRMIDNVIDLNYYPVEEAKNSNFKHRPVGMGIRGLQDALYKMDIKFDSEEQVKFSDESMEIISYYIILASSELAKERGVYASYAGSKWSRNILPQDTVALVEEERGRIINLEKGGKKDWTPVREHIKQYGMRNSNTMAIAPNAATANLVGCTPSVEPIFKNLYVKSNLSGDFVVLNRYLMSDLKERGLWKKELLDKIKFADGSVQNIPEIPDDLKAKYKEAFEIDARWLIRGAAARGKWIDQSQSINIFYKGNSGKDISEIYKLAWDLGLKTTYYLRTLAASQVEKSTVATQDFGATHQRDFTKEKMEKMQTVSSAISPISPISQYTIHKNVNEESCEGCSA